MALSGSSREHVCLSACFLLAAAMAHVDALRVRVEVSPCPQVGGRPLKGMQLHGLTAWPAHATELLSMCPGPWLLVHRPGSGDDKHQLGLRSDETTR